MYKTKQKSQLIDFFKSNMSEQMSVGEIITGVCGESEQGKSTVYRLLSKMVKDGSLLRINDTNSKSVLYQYTGEGTHCNEHFHLKCTVCGKLFHLDCCHLEEIGQHIQSEHNFILDNKKTLFYGKCSECAGGRVDEKNN